MSDEISDKVWDVMKDSYNDRCVKCGCKSEFYKGSSYEFGVNGVYICSRCNYAFPPITDHDAVNMRLITKKKFDKLTGAVA
jgi:hypothetical protein